MSQWPAVHSVLSQYLSRPIYCVLRVYADSEITVKLRRQEQIYTITVISTILNKVYCLYFHPLEVVSRYRYPQLQVCKVI